MPCNHNHAVVIASPPKDINSTCKENYASLGRNSIRVKEPKDIKDTSMFHGDFSQYSKCLRRLRGATPPILETDGGFNRVHEELSCMFGE